MPDHGVRGLGGGVVGLAAACTERSGAALRGPASSAGDGAATPMVGLAVAGSESGGASASTGRDTSRLARPALTLRDAAAQPTSRHADDNPSTSPATTTTLHCRSCKGLGAAASTSSQEQTVHGVHTPAADSKNPLMHWHSFIMASRGSPATSSAFRWHGALAAYNVTLALAVVSTRAGAGVPGTAAVSSIPISWVSLCSKETTDVVALAVLGTPTEYRIKVLNVGAIELISVGLTPRAEAIS